MQEISKEDPSEGHKSREGERCFLVEGSGQLHRWMKIVVVPFRFKFGHASRGIFDLVGLRSPI